MTTTRTHKFDIQELMNRPALTSEEAAYLMGDRKSSVARMHTRMLELHQKGLVRRVPGLAPYSWVTASVLDYIETAGK